MLSGYLHCPIVNSFHIVKIVHIVYIVLIVYIVHIAYENIGLRCLRKYRLLKVFFC